MFTTSTMASQGETCLPSYEYIFNPILLKNQVAFITGGGTGIGFTIAEILMRHGCTTVIASRNFKKLKQSAETLARATGQQCFPIQMDVRKPEEVINAVDKTLSLFKRIDILVNNAAGNFVAPITSLSVNAYNTVLQIDTVGTFTVSKVIYEKYMQNHGGVIINMTATLGYRGNVFQAHAGSAKAAVDALTRHFAVEWGPSNVRVIGIAPGLTTESGFTRILGDSATVALTESINQSPLQRVGSRIDVAHAVLFSVSPAASMVTGHIIVMDGGHVLSSANSIDHMISGIGGNVKSKI